MLHLLDLDSEDKRRIWKTDHLLVAPAVQSLTNVLVMVQQLVVLKQEMKLCQHVRACLLWFFVGVCWPLSWMSDCSC